MSAWEAVKIVVPLIGIAVVLANLLGLWATPGQTAAREERKKWAAEKRQWEEQQRQFREEQREKDKRLDDAFRSF